MKLISYRITDKARDVSFLAEKFFMPDETCRSCVIEGLYRHVFYDHVILHDMTIRYMEFR